MTGQHVSWPAMLGDQDSQETVGRKHTLAVCVMGGVGVRFVPVCLVSRERVYL